MKRIPSALGEIESYGTLKVLKISVGGEESKDRSKTMNDHKEDVIKTV